MQECLIRAGLRLQVAGVIFRRLYNSIEEFNIKNQLRYIFCQFFNLIPNTLSDTFTAPKILSRTQVASMRDIFC